MRKQIAAANWKMNLTLQQAESLVDELMAQPYELAENQEVVLGVPFPYLTIIKNKIAGKKKTFLLQHRIVLIKKMWMFRIIIYHFPKFQS